VKSNLPKVDVIGVVETMADIGLRSKMLVKDVMSSPVVTVEEKASANLAAEMMDKSDVGCIIVTGKEGKPLGILTERDLVVRVLAKNVKPDSVKANDVMTSPLITVDSEESITQAARRMSRLNIRRLGVVYKGNLVGLISSKDILGVMPELIEIIQERARIQGEDITEEETEKETAPLAGFCDRCGNYSEKLYENNGQYLCEDCKAELESEE
jgi:CBS domain-containing protein